MTTALDRPLGRAALRLISQFGKSAVLTRITSTYNPATRGVSETSEAHAIKCLVEDYSDHLRDGTTIQQGDRKITLAARGLSFDPQPTTQVDGVTYRDTITVDGQVFQVFHATPVFSGERIALWTVQGRR